MDTEIYFPLIDVNIDLPLAVLPVPVPRHRGTSNGVNLTDGLDGLGRGHVRDLADHAARDRADRLDPLRRTPSPAGATSTSTSRSSRPR
jgi:hypothetical protein